MFKKNHFADLTSYCNQIAPFTLEGVKNVGWLDFESEFSQGEIPKSTFHKLKDLVGSVGVFKPLVEPIRESLVCEVCGAFEMLGHAGKKLPNAELWIPSNETIYAAPINILHYIEVHNYLPPAEFISAIDVLDENFPFVADDIYREKLRLSDWGRLSVVEKRNLAAIDNI